MLVRLTFVKRYTREGLLYRNERVYRVDETLGAELVSLTVNDMPVFRIVLEAQLSDKERIVELSELEEDALPAKVAVEESAEDMEARIEAEHKANLKALADKKKSAAKPAKTEKPAGKLSVAKKSADASNVEMVT